MTINDISWIFLILFASFVFISLMEYFFPLRNFDKKTFKKNKIINIAFFFFITLELALFEKLNVFDWLPKQRAFSFNLWIVDLIFYILLLDLLSYCWHRINHRISFFWRWHSLHHKIESLDLLAAYRFHPIEVFFGHHLRMLVLYFLGADLFIVQVFVVLYSFFNFLEHSNWAIPKFLEEKILFFFVTPEKHHTHHLRQKKYQNSNFGTLFIIWDWLFGTYLTPPARQQNDIGLK